MSKWHLALLFAVAMVAVPCPGQSRSDDEALAHATQLRGFWSDSDTGLTWIAKDNGSDVNWKQAKKFCAALHVGIYADWRLPELQELETIYDESKSASGLAGPPKSPRPAQWHVKGGLFLTGNQWTNTMRLIEGRPSGYPYRFDFNEGREFEGDEVSFRTNKRALCVRGAYSTASTAP